MTTKAKPDAREIRLARVENPKMRERDLAVQLGVSEADFVAAHVGEGVVRIEPRVGDLLAGMKTLGEIMVLTRNDSAVHEKIGVVEKVAGGDKTALTLGENIDLRIFPQVWAHGFAVEKRDGDAVRRSLQFFDHSGEAVFKVHLRPASDIAAYEALVASLLSDDQSQAIETSPVENDAFAKGEAGSAEELRAGWSAMTDVHQFFGLLRSLKLDRKQALSMVGDDYAWELASEALAAMMHQAAQDEIPIMCFVGSRGCVQIHSGPIRQIKPMGPWINVLDETFHLHLRLDHVREVWVVRKPTSDGHVTSIEAFDAQNRLIIQFFGQRHEGEVERPDWRRLAESLPRIPRQSAA